MKPLCEDEAIGTRQKLANYPLLERANPDSVSTLVKRAELVKAPKGTKLLTEGEPASNVFFLLDGAVRVFNSHPDGREFTPKIYAAPAHFGDLELIAGTGFNSATAVTLGDTVLAVVDWKTLRELILVDHQLCAGWLSGIAAQFVKTIDVDRHNVFLGIPGRVANALLSYGELFGTETEEGIRVDVPMSRNQLAKQVGACKRSIINVVQNFVEKGWVDFEGTSMVIKKSHALMASTLQRRLGLNHQAQTTGLLEVEKAMSA